MRKSVISGWARDDVSSGESMIAPSYSTHGKDARRGEGEDARQDGSAASAGAQIGSWGAIHAALSIRRGGPLRSLSLRVTQSEGCQRIGVHVDTLRLLHPPFLRRGDRLIAIPTAECSWRVDWGNTNVVHRGASGDRPAVTLVERLVMSIQTTPLSSYLFHAQSDCHSSPCYLITDSRPSAKGRLDVYS